MVEYVDVVVVGFVQFGVLYLAVLEEGPTGLPFRFPPMSHIECFVLLVVRKTHEVGLQMVEVDSLWLSDVFEEVCQVFVVLEHNANVVFYCEDSELLEAVSAGLLVGYVVEDYGVGSVPNQVLLALGNG